MSRPRLCREEARCRILLAADGLFRQYGFGKTTVADIAKELGMSSANIYKFFPSRNALVEACAERNLAVLKEMVSGILEEGGSVFDRLEKVVLTVFRHHRDLLRNERQIFKLVLTAREENWGCVRDFDVFIADVLRRLIEQGCRSGEFDCGNSAETTDVLRDSLWVALCPHMRHDYQPDESEERVLRQIRFLGRALKSRG